MFPGVYFGFKFHEPAPHFKITNHGAMEQNVLNRNLNTWGKLPKDVLKSIDEGAASYETVAIEDSYRSEAAGIAKLKAAGAKVTVLPVEQQAKWRRLSRIGRTNVSTTSTKGMGSTVPRSWKNI